VTASVPPVLQAALANLSPKVQGAFTEHLVGGTSADYLSGWLARMGTPVGATTIKSYRRALRQRGV
jgi:hypothetical protein